MLKDTLRADKGAMAKLKALRTSPRKLNLVAASIRGKSAASALTMLTFEKRRVAQDVKKLLQSAIANAENNHGLDVDKLYVAEAWCGRAFVMKRFMARGRGKSSGIEKPFSNITIVVKERESSTEMTPSRARGLSKAKTEGKKAPAAKAKKVGA